MQSIKQLTIQCQHSWRMQYNRPYIRSSNTDTAYTATTIDHSIPIPSNTNTAYAGSSIEHKETEPVGFAFEVGANDLKDEIGMTPLDRSIQQNAGEN